jgi:hypothetical protein
VIPDSELRIPKNEVRVEIRLSDGGESEDFFFFLNQCSPFHHGPETLDEFLNACRGFIPVRHAARQEALLLNMNDILFVHEKEPCEESGERTIRLQFHGLVEMEVRHFEMQPLFHARPIDFFNSAPAFLSFLHGGRKIYINKSHVAKVSGI